MERCFENVNSGLYYKNILIVISDTCVINDESRSINDTSSH